MMDNFILKQALKNAVLHDGKADMKAVLNKAMGERGKDDMKALASEVKEVIDHVNLMGINEQKGQLLELWPEALDKKVEEKKVLKDLPGDTSKVVLRMAPNPNAPLTFGGSRGVVINGEYAKKYNGRYIIRLDDTDPDIKKPMKEAYDWIPEDVRWLGYDNFDVVMASDRVELYYKMAEDAISKGAAYTCTCGREAFSELKKKGIDCPCREKDKKTIINEWKQMLAGKYDEGSIVLRVKTSMQHRNPGERDWVAFRIKKGEHPRTGSKYVVWPMLDFQSAIDDHDLKVTHILRGKDLMHSTFKQKHLYDKMGWTYPETLYWGKVEMHEFGKLSKSEFAAAIEKGEYTGWDDPRLPTLRGMRKKGIKPEAIVEFWMEMGVSERDVSASMEILEAINRKHI